MTTLLSLIGEQPIPVLLVHRALQPRRHILLHTNTTRRQAQNLAAMLPKAEPIPIAAYDLANALRAFQTLLATASEPVLNLTAGTKPMAWAGYEAARQSGAPFVYLRSEGKRSVLYRYGFTPQGPTLLETPSPLPPLLSLQDYLQAHGLREESRLIASNAQEVALTKFLERQVDELAANVKFPAFEIDFLVRRGNQVAVIEAKNKKKSTRFGIDQLTTITGREYLGTYTGRIWVVANPPGEQLQELARAYRIEIVRVALHQPAPGRWRLTPTSQQRLAQTLDRVLGPRAS